MYSESSKDFRSGNSIQNLEEISSKPFSCDARGAFDELTSLYKHRIDLQARHKRGEANRARTATITRKTQQAEAAEGAFRICVQKMVPELLGIWDDMLKKNQLDLRNSNKFYDKDGITMEVLKKTADMLESVESKAL